jgi:hypothetical protein
MLVRLVDLRTIHPSLLIACRTRKNVTKLRTDRFRNIFIPILFLAVLVAGVAVRANAQQAAMSSANARELPDAPGFGAAATVLDSQPTATQPTGVISGTVLDTNGNVIQDAHVVLTNHSGTIERILQSGPNGQFSFTGLPAGSFKLRVTGKAMGTYVSPAISLHDDEMYIAVQVVLPIASASTDVTVYGDKEELAQEQVHIAIEQRVLGVFPNFYSTYDWNAPPMGPKQKFHLALRSQIDPVTFLGVAGIAGAEHYQGVFPAYGAGFQGYAKRYGSAYANNFSGKMLGSAIFPSLFHQDPRYFYNGKGSVVSRALYAVSRAVIAKSDGGHWQPNYSHVLGNFVAGGVSNLYYPESSRGWPLMVNTGLVETAMNAADNIIREFFLKGMTSHAPGNVVGKP